MVHGVSACTCRSPPPRLARCALPVPGPQERQLQRPAAAGQRVERGPGASARAAAVGGRDDQDEQAREKEGGAGARRASGHAGMLGAGGTASFLSRSWCWPGRAEHAGLPYMCPALPCEGPPVARSAARQPGPHLRSHLCWRHTLCGSPLAGRPRVSFSQGVTPRSVQGVPVIPRRRGAGKGAVIRGAAWAQRAHHGPQRQRQEQPLQVGSAGRVGRRWRPGGAGGAVEVD